MIFLHWWPFCIRHHFTFVFVLSVAVIVRFAIESFCSVFSCLFRDWDRWFYKDHRSFFNFYMFYEYNRLFCQNVFFTLSAAHSAAPGRKRPQNSFDRFSWYRKNKTSKHCQQITRGGTSGGLRSHQQRGFRPLFRWFMGSVDSNSGGSQMRTL